MVYYYTSHYIKLPNRTDISATAVKPPPAFNVEADLWNNNK